MSVFTKEQIWASNGHPKTNSLFTETCRHEDEPIASLKGNTSKPVPCLRDYYVDLVAEDPSEYVFAETVFGDLRYWLRLKEATWMKPYLEEWGQLADIKRKQLAFKAILDEVKLNGRSAFTAAKFLIDEPWKEKTKEVKATTKKTSKQASEFFKADYDEDIKRMKEVLN